MALHFDPKNSEILALSNDADKKFKAEQKAKEQKVDAKKEVSSKLEAELRKRNIYMGKKLIDMPEG